MIADKHDEEGKQIFGPKWLEPKWLRKVLNGLVPDKSSFQSPASLSRGLTWECSWSERALEVPGPGFWMLCFVVVLCLEAMLLQLRIVVLMHVRTAELRVQ